MLTERPIELRQSLVDPLIGMMRSNNHTLDKDEGVGDAVVREEDAVAEVEALQSAPFKAISMLTQDHGIVATDAVEEEPVSVMPQVSEAMGSRPDPHPAVTEGISDDDIPGTSDAHSVMRLWTEIAALDQQAASLPQTKIPLPVLTPCFCDKPEKHTVSRKSTTLSAAEGDSVRNPGSIESRSSSSRSSSRASSPTRSMNFGGCEGCARSYVRRANSDVASTVDSSGSQSQTWTVDTLRQLKPKRMKSFPPNTKAPLVVRRY